MATKRIDPSISDEMPPGTSVDENGYEGQVLWQASEGQVVNAGWIIFTFFGFWLVFPLLITVWKMIVTRCHSYALTGQRLREQAGVFSRNVEELELYRVKDISVQQPLLQRLLGRGEVVLVTSDRTTPTILLSAIPNPIAVADLIRRSVEQCRVAKGVREID